MNTDIRELSANETMQVSGAFKIKERITIDDLTFYFRDDGHVMVCGPKTCDMLTPVLPK